jgi:hypothetical protein
VRSRSGRSNRRSLSSWGPGGGRLAGRRRWAPPFARDLQSVVDWRPIPRLTGASTRARHADGGELLRWLSSGWGPRLTSGGGSDGDRVNVCLCVVTKIKPPPRPPRLRAAAPRRFGWDRSAGRKCTSRRRRAGGLHMFAWPNDVRRRRHNYLYTGCACVCACLMSSHNRVTRSN